MRGGGVERQKIRLGDQVGVVAVAGPPRGASGLVATAARLKIFTLDRRDSL